VNDNKKARPVKAKNEGVVLMVLGKLLLVERNRNGCHKALYLLLALATNDATCSNSSPEGARYERDAGMRNDLKALKGRAKNNHR